MNSNPNDIHPVFDRMLNRESKQALLKQRATVIWLYGLSGSGKSTLACALERRLHDHGYLTQVLDGDNIRTGLNKNLGFSDEDRLENIRRIAEVARLFLNAGVVTIASFITPRNELRQLARDIIGGDDLLDVYVKCSYETCEVRDVKGLYAKARQGALKQFTGKDSGFEEPDHASLVIDTDRRDLKTSLNLLWSEVQPRIEFSS